jgi:hypothetical protein
VEAELLVEGSEVESIAPTMASLSCVTSIIESKRISSRLELILLIGRILGRRRSLEVVDFEVVDFRVVELRVAGVVGVVGVVESATGATAGVVVGRSTGVVGVVGG